MEGYKGQTDITDEYNARHKTNKLIQDMIVMYGGIDGSHHKDWLLDQIARLSHGGLLKVYMAEWENGHTELRLGEVSKTEEYMKWREALQKCDDSECACHDPDDDYYCYEYSEGITP